MRLLGFQREAVDAVVHFTNVYTQLSVMPTVATSHASANAAWVVASLPAAAGRPYSETRTSSSESVPTAAVVLPTGGGKTITGACAGVEVARALGNSEIFLVWMVPSDAIFAQTELAFGPGGWLRSVIQQEYGMETNLKTTHSVWSDNDFRLDTVTVLLVSMQALVGDSNILRFYRSADLVAGLSIWTGPEDQPSLAALLEEKKPIFIIDEAHRVYTVSGRSFFSGGNYASFIVELTATPRPYSAQDYPNIAYAASAAQLIEESLLKNPLEYHLEPTSTVEELLANCIQKRGDLERLLQTEDYFTPPKVLVSGRFTHERHSAHERSAHFLRQRLLDLGVPAEQVAIKSSSVNEIRDIDLDSPDVQVRYIITSRALAEGWDVKSVFIVALLNEIGAPLTTFQLVGRGLRQPNRLYFNDGELNKLHVYANSITQDDAVRELNSFLEGEGLTGIWIDVTGPATTYEIPLPPPVTVPQPIVMGSNTFKRSWLVEAEAERVARLPLSEILFSTPRDSSTTTLDLAQEGTPISRTYFTAGGRDDPAEAWRRDFLLGGMRSLAPLFSHSTEAGAYLSSQYADWATDPAFQRLASVPPLAAVRQLLGHVRDQLKSVEVEVFFRDVLPSATFTRASVPSSTALPVRHLSPDPTGTQPFRNSVFGDFPKSLLNPDELIFARFLDSHEVPWFRNPSQRGWYSLPLLGGHMYPDFGILLDPVEGESRSFSRILLVETKGAHLIANADSERKRRACADVTSLSGGLVTALFETFSDARSAVSVLLA